MSTVSVIVPVYKVEPYIHRCVDSVLAQTFTDFELILVDDGSPDKCGEICEEYAAKDHRVHVIHQKNGGLSAARNAGINWAFANSSSQWISFIDSDDWVHPCFLDYLYRAVRDNNVDVSACEIIRTDSYLPFSDVIFQAEVKDWEQFYISGWVKGVVAWNKLYRKELFSTFRYPVGKINEDEFVTYLILEKSEKVATLDVALYYYFQNPQGIMARRFSHKNLDGLIALSEQCKFAKKNGYKDFYVSRMKARISRIFEFKKACEDSTNIDEHEKKRIVRFLQADLRKILISEGESIAPFKEFWYYYDWAFPDISWVYWTFNRVVGKVKRLLHL